MHTGRVPWPLDLPPHDHRDWWARRAAAWCSALLPPEAATAVPELHVHPRAAGRVAWRWMHASLDARGRDMHTLAMSRVIPPGELDGLLAGEDIAMLRALDVPAATAAREDLERRLEELAAVGPHLPRTYPQT